MASRIPDADWPDRKTSILPAILVGLLFLGTLIPAAPFVLQTGIFFAMAGLLMAIAPPRAELPKAWLILGSAFLILGAASLLPVSWFPIPAWRKHLEALGLETGPHVAIQWRQVLEQHGIFAMMILTGIWITGQRTPSHRLWLLALAFTVGVALYALMAEGLREPLSQGRSLGHFGFFPNRNHSSTYLAMGAICGIGVMLQAFRKKRRWYFFIAAAATALCLWAVFHWSISRAGIVLCAAGFILWIGLLGWKYWDSNQLKIVVLLALLVAGVYAIAESRVKTRLSTTTESLSGRLAGDEAFSSHPVVDRWSGMDARLPVAFDTLEMIRDTAWTGVGAAQYRYVFPQYAKRTAFYENSQFLHPESDWLWMAAENGVPATLMLMALVVVAWIHAIRNINAGRDRALRMGCLAAATLVPLHGIFDVPGHRPVLAWTAVLLYTLSLNRLPDHPPGSGRRWFFRIAGVLFLLIGIRLLGESPLGFKPPYLVRAQQSVAEGSVLYNEANRLSAAESLGTRQRLLSLTRDAISFAPLETRLHRLQAFALAPDAGTRIAADQAFLIERELDPVRIKPPLTQAREWFSYDPQRASQIWLEALRRADWMDKNHPNSEPARKRTENFILQQASQRPVLKLAAEKVLQWPLKPSK